MNPLAVIVGIILMLFVAQTGELPILVLALLLFLNVADEDTVVALARKLGKIYYKLNKGVSELLGLNGTELKANELLGELLRKEASWRASRISKIREAERKREELLDIIYKRIMEESELEKLDLRALTKKGS